MPKVKIYCELKHPSSAKISPNDEYNFEFCREVDVPTSDLTPFYYAIRTYFRKDMSDDEKSLVISHIPNNKDAIRLIKRRKSVALKDVFPNNYYVEGVDKIGPNRYQLLWGV